jgi:hypothetical protein
MWAWWLYPDVGLLQSDIDILAAHPAFAPVLDPTPTPTATPVPDPNDLDGDGWPNDVEDIIGTDPLDACADNPNDDAWPVDFNNDASITSSDLSAVSQYVGQSVPPAPARVDIDPPSQPDGVITSGDLSQVASLIGQGCTP